MQCRIAITTKCNLKCEYCCMKYPEILASFKKIDNIRDIDLNKYDTAALTGGEPLLVPETLLSHIWYLKYKNKKVYLYTNGTLLTEEFAKLMKLYEVDGINIGLHNPKKTMNEKLENIHKIIPIRLLVWKKLADKNFYNYVNKNSMQYRLWVKDECENKEDRFIL